MTIRKIFATADVRKTITNIAYSTRIRCTFTYTLHTITHTFISATMHTYTLIRNQIRRAQLVYCCLEIKWKRWILLIRPFLPNIPTIAQKHNRFHILRSELWWDFRAYVYTQRAHTSHARRTNEKWIHKVTFSAASLWHSKLISTASSTLHCELHTGH